MITKNNNWIYTGVFLENELKKLLLNTVKKYIDIPENWKYFCHHMTIAFNNKTDNAQNSFDLIKNRIGEQVTLTVTHFEFSNDAVAVKVTPSTNLPIQNSIAHVTVATPPDGKPVNSNKIQKWHELETKFEIYGIINVFNKN